MPPGHDGRSRRRALRFDIVIVEANTLIGQLVCARGGYRAAVHPEISPADVVHQNEDDVGREPLDPYGQPAFGRRRPVHLLSAPGSHGFLVLPVGVNEGPTILEKTSAAGG